MKPLPKDLQSSSGDADPDALASRDFLEGSLSLWEEALSQEPPSVKPEDQQPRQGSRLGIGQSVTAPRVASEQVAPSQVYTYEGFAPVEEEGLRELLRSAAQAVAQVPVEIRLGPEVLAGPADAARVFVFDEPVHEAADSRGRILRAVSGGRRVEWEAGQAATLLVEVISGATAQQATPEQVALSCVIEAGGIAYWKRAE